MGPDVLDGLGRPRGRGAVAGIASAGADGVVGPVGPPGARARDGHPVF